MNLQKYKPKLNKTIKIGLVVITLGVIISFIIVKIIASAAVARGNDKLTVNYWNGNSDTITLGTLNINSTYHYRGFSSLNYEDIDVTGMYELSGRGGDGAGIEPGNYSVNFHHSSLGGQTYNYYSSGVEGGTGSTITLTPVRIEKGSRVTINLGRNQSRHNTSYFNWSLSKPNGVYDVMGGNTWVMADSNGNIMIPDAASHNRNDLISAGCYSIIANSNGMRYAALYGQSGEATSFVVTGPDGGKLFTGICASGSGGVVLLGDCGQGEKRGIDGDMGGDTELRDALSYTDLENNYPSGNAYQKLKDIFYIGTFGPMGVSSVCSHLNGDGLYPVSVGGTGILGVTVGAGGISGIVYTDGTIVRADASKLSYERDESPYGAITCKSKEWILNNPSRTGYEFLGWSCSEGITYVDNGNGTCTFTITTNYPTITANWKPLNATQTVIHQKWDAANKKWVEFKRTTEDILIGTVYTPQYTTTPQGFYNYSIDDLYTVTAAETKYAYYYPNSYTQTVIHYKWDEDNHKWIKFDKKETSALYGSMYTPQYITPPNGWKTHSIDDAYTVTGNTTKNAYYYPIVYTIHYDDGV